MAKNDNNDDVVETAAIVGRPSKGEREAVGEPRVVETVFGRDHAAGGGASTFAERAKARAAAEKRIGKATNKAVTPDESEGK